jgi:hypothetical protein
VKQILNRVKLCASSLDESHAAVEDGKMMRPAPIVLPRMLRTSFVVLAYLILSQFVSGCATVGEHEVGQSDRLSGERVKIRGRIIAAEGENLKVTTAAGEVLVHVPENTRLSGIAAAQLSEITVGTYVGTAAVKQADGNLRALEVHIFPEEARGAGEGHRPWDLTPDSTMTNANVEKVEQVSVEKVQGSLLTLKYKGGEAKVFIPPGTPIVKNVPADRSALKQGAGVYIAAVRGDDGTVTATRVAVGLNGIMPPM